jgi:PTS system maltose and glucose-specific IIC component
MRGWHSLFEILRFPLEMIFLASLMLGLGNLLTNPAFALASYIDNSAVAVSADMLMQTGRFILVNFPFLILVRLSARKGMAGTTIITGIAGYIAFLMATVFFAKSNLPSTAYSSLLGISVSSSTMTSLKVSTHYPLQTGVIGTALVSAITLFSFHRFQKKNNEKVLGLVSWETSCTALAVLLCFLAGVGISYLWPYVIAGIQKIISFIAVDTTNPINLTLYGVMDGLLNTLGLGAMIRTPFWYSASGGTWINLAGASIAGDVNIWSAQLAAGTISGISGRFITPYYVLNIFAVPGMIWALFSLYTDKEERAKRRFLAIVVTIVSVMSGTLLPLELMLLFLCPFLFFLHLGYSGILFGVMQALHCYLGYNTAVTNTISALPGSLPEFLTYLSIPSMQKTLLVVTAVGIVSMFAYFFMTRAYFKYAAIDLFNTGDKARLVDGTIKAVGGVENIKVLQSSMHQLTIQVFDPSKVDVERLKELGAYGVYESRLGFKITYGACSTMVRRGIGRTMRESIRNLKVQDDE